VFAATNAVNMAKVQTVRWVAGFWVVSVGCRKLLEFRNYVGLYEFWHGGKLCHDCAYRDYVVR